MYRSTNGGDTWSGISAGLPPNMFITSLVVDPKTPTILYIGGDGVYRSSNSGTTWQPMNTGLLSGTVVLSLAADPVTPSTLYIGSTNYPLATTFAYRSTNGGVSWSPIDIDLPGPVQMFAIDPKKPSRLYAGTYQGVYLSDDSGATWRCISLPNDQVTALALHPEDTDILYVGTRRGVFVQTPVPSEQVRHSFLSLING
jgi:photosystem II stability/assembly factor-like uncharacterized protein